MDADARRIRELEHGFRRDGLPNLMLRVATGVAGFAGLYYAVTILVDSAYRDQFVDTLSQQLRDTFERRSEYLDLLRRRGVAVVPGEPTGGHADPAVQRSSPESGRSSAT
jgi:hypothetical protein